MIDKLIRDNIKAFEEKTQETFGSFYFMEHIDNFELGLGLVVKENTSKELEIQDQSCINPLFSECTVSELRIIRSPKAPTYVPPERPNSDVDVTKGEIETKPTIDSTPFVYDYHYNNYARGFFSYSTLYKISIVLNTVKSKSKLFIRLLDNPHLPKTEFFQISRSEVYEILQNHIEEGEAELQEFFSKLVVTDIVLYENLIQSLRKNDEKSFCENLLRLDGRKIYDVCYMFDLLYKNVYVVQNTFNLNQPFPMDFDDFDKYTLRQLLEGYESLLESFANILDKSQLPISLQDVVLGIIDTPYTIIGFDSEQVICPRETKTEIYKLLDDKFSKSQKIKLVRGIEEVCKTLKAEKDKRFLGLFGQYLFNELVNKDNAYKGLYEALNDFGINIGKTAFYDYRNLGETSDDERNTPELIKSFKNYVNTQVNK